MKTNFTIKNFRVFDNNGATVEIAPLTFLVGCNSSGKSSIVKALTLLKTFLQQKHDKDHPIVGSLIDFSAKPNDSLGTFSNAVRSNSRKKVITLAYDVHSLYINQDITVSLDVIEGAIGNGIVGDVRISLPDGRIITDRGSLHYLKDSFKQFLIASSFSSYVSNKVEMYCSGNWDPELIREIENSCFDENNQSYHMALKYCTPDYIKQVYYSKGITFCDLKKCPKEAIDKFISTGILSYFSLLDDVKDISEPNALRRFLKNKIKEDDYQSALNVAIDAICDEYSTSEYSDFMSYYLSLENDFLTIHSFEQVLFNHSSDPFYSFFNTTDTVKMLDSMIAINEILWDVSYKAVRDVLIHLSDNDPFLIKKKPGFENEWIHPLCNNVFKEFINKFLLEIGSKDVTDDLDYISSSRIQVRRLYPLEDKNEFTDSVRRYYESKTRFMTLETPISVNVMNEGGIIEDGLDYHKVEISDFEPGLFMNKWLQVFNIGNHISMEMDNNGLGLLLKVYRTKSDKKGVLLADMGYGITQLFSILLQIEEMIMSGLYENYHGKVAKKEEIAHGLVAHIVCDFNKDPMKAQTVAIEEPEIHLHPKYQSLLAEMIYEAYRDYNIQFIIETHSEYLLRKIQTLIGSKHLTPDEVSMIYVEDDAEVKKGEKKVRRIPIKEDGRLAEPFGHGFYDEADNLSLELFTNMGK